jgi:hypothetical protein
MARSLDEIFPELQRARREYESAAGASERVRLSRELDRLRAEAREAAGDPVTHLSDRDLAQGIRRLRQRLADLSDRKLSTGHVGTGPESGGLDARQVVRHNAEIDATFSRDDLERDLRRLLAEKQRRAG